MSMKRWENRVAFVVGASSGIGAAIAEDLVKSGMKVVGFARRTHLIEALAEKLKSEKGKLFAVNGDITKGDEVLAAFQWVDKYFGELSVLVNSAGVLRASKISEFDLEKWRNIFDVNVLGLGLCTSEAIKLMKKYKIDGQIVLINSISGHRYPAATGILPYSITKHSVTNLANCLRKELLESKTNIKITNISPGLVKTDFVAESFKEDPNRSALSPRDVSNAVVYSLSVPQHVNIFELTVMPVGTL